MKKRTYRAARVKSLDLEKLGEELRGSERVVFSVDVAKDEMYATVKTEAERVYATMRWSHLEETRRVVKWLTSLAPRVEVALEPSGTYGDALRWQLEQASLAVYRVSPKKVNDSREIYDGVPSSHDAKAAAIVGWLHWQGRSERWRVRSEADRTVKAKVTTLVLFQQPYRRCLNRLESRLARHWPELSEALDLDSAALLELLMEFGGPAGVAAAPRQAQELLRRVGGCRLERKKVEAVVGSSRTTLGMAMVAAECQALRALATETRRLQQAVRRAQRAVEAASVSDPLLERMGRTVGKVTAAVLTVHSGRVSSYRNARCYEKALGLNLKVRSSGRYQGQLKLTKRGSAVARQYLYLASMRLIKTEPLARAWYEAKVKRDGGRVKKKALIAVMRKLTRALWWVGQGQAFDIDKLFDGRRLQIASA